MRPLVAKKLTKSTPSRPKSALQAHITGGTRKLDQTASELAVKGEPSDGFVWVVKAPDGRTDLYLDAGIAVASIQSWANLRCRKFGLMKTSALPTLWISGLIKTGKSYTLREVVPAVLAETLRQQPPGHPLEGMAVLQLNGVELKRQAVVDWATRAGVPVEEGTWRWVRQVLDSGPDAPGAQTRAGRAVVEMFTSGFQGPVLVLLDEVQALLQPTDARGDLDASGAAFIRDGVLRQILVNSADNVLWAVTGSSMAMAWMALAAMPVNGTAPLMQIWPVHLPSAFPPALMRELVNDMAQRHMRKQGQDTYTGVDGDDMERLLEWSEGSPALFATMLESWLARSSIPENALVDVGTFVSWFMKTKMLEEVLKEWKLGLAGLTDAQRGDVLDLASPTLGVQVDDLMNMGLWRFLQPHLLQTQQGARYYLKNASQRQLLRAIIDHGGKLRTNWTGISGGLTLIQLDWGWLLLQLGEVADYLLGLRPSRKGAVPERISGVDQFTVMLQSLAEKIGAQLPVVAAGESDNTTGSLASRWEALGAFSQVLRSPANTAACRWYESEGRAKKKLQCNLDFLVFFLRLCRNVLAHQKPWDGPAVMVVVMALPRLLGMPAGELAEVVRCGMGGLAPATIKEAEAVAADQDQDGDDGQGNSSGAGGGMSCY